MPYISWWQRMQMRIKLFFRDAKNVRCAECGNILEDKYSVLCQSCFDRRMKTIEYEKKMLRKNIAEGR